MKSALVFALAAEPHLPSSSITRQARPTPRLHRDPVRNQIQALLQVFCEAVRSTYYPASSALRCKEPVLCMVRLRHTR
jgi:hypothetical protein